MQTCYSLKSVVAFLVGKLIDILSYFHLFDVLFLYLFGTGFSFLVLEQLMLKGLV